MPLVSFADRASLSLLNLALAPGPLGLVQVGPPGHGPLALPVDSLL